MQLEQGNLFVTLGGYAGVIFRVESVAGRSIVATVVRANAGVAAGRVVVINESISPQVIPQSHLDAALGKVAEVAEPEPEPTPPADPHPLPWAVRNAGRCGVEIHDARGELIVWASTIWADRHRNAARIVTAVNQHDTLRDLLRRVTDSLLFHVDCGGRVNPDSLVGQANEALDETAT